MSAITSVGHCRNFCIWKKIQLLRSPVSPSGTRRRPDGTRDTISRITDSVSARLTLPLKWAWVGGMERLPSSDLPRVLPGHSVAGARCQEVVAGLGVLRRRGHGLSGSGQQQVAERAVFAKQPLAVQQVRAAKVGPVVGAGEPVDGFAV